MQPGQVPVQHEHVVAGERHVVERVLPVEHHVDGHALVAQPGRHRLREPFVIFNHQHSHALSQPGSPVTMVSPAARMPGRK